MSKNFGCYLMFKLDSNISCGSQKLTQLRLNATKSMEQLVVTGIYSKLAKVEHAASKSSQKRVITWGKKLQWNTHKAVNQRRGEWVDKKKQNHIWNDKL